MKSHHKYRFWYISLTVHLCLAIVFSFIAINQTNLRDVDALNVGIYQVEPVPTVKKLSVVKPPTALPAATPEFQIDPQLASAQTRALTTQPANTTPEYAIKSVPMDPPVSPSPAESVHSEIAAQEAARISRVNHHTAQLPATAVNLPSQVNASLTVARSAAGSHSDGIGNEGGSSIGRGDFNTQGGADGTWMRDRVGLSSLIDAEGAANIEDTLSDVDEKVALGGGIPELPHGTPGAIVVGRGRNIRGRLNLARFEDPLHPSADI